MSAHYEITPQLLLEAYCQGLFPMAPSNDSTELHWYSPEMRGVLPLDTFHVPKSLEKFLRKSPFHITFNQAFETVIRACGESRDERPSSWINEEIIQLYTELHEHGYAHSVEVWQEEKLVGGLYGVQIGAAYFGESMFSYAPNASKSGLVALVKHLRAQGFLLLDTQYVNEHLTQFGCIAIPREIYLRKLKEALKKDVQF